MFLTFESARKAVRDLIEFDPNQVESSINILINELTTYNFLLQQFGVSDETRAQDFRYARLKLRQNSYREIVGRTYWRAIDRKEYWTNRATIETQKLARIPHIQLESDVGREQIRRISVECEFAKQWAKAAETAHELEKRYDTLFPGQAISRFRHS